MAKFGEEYAYNYMPIKEFYKLPIAYGKSNFFINIGRNSVVKVFDNKIIQTWVLKQPHTFTCPVVYSSVNESLFCIMDSKILITWSIEEDTLKNAKKIKFQENLFTIISLHDGVPLIIFSNGLFIKYDSLLNEESPIAIPFQQPETDVIWADAAVQGHRIKVFCVTISKNIMYKLHSFCIVENCASVEDYAEKTLSRKSCTLKSWCLNKLNSSFLAFWSDGTIENQTKSGVLNISDIKPEHKISIDTVDSSHIALIKYNPEAKESILELWDTKFPGRKAKKSLKVTCSHPVQMSVLNCVLFLRSVESLIAVPISVEKSTLASAIGKTTETPKAFAEYSWNNEGKLVPLSKKVESYSPEGGKVKNEKKISPEYIEMIAKKLLENSFTYMKCPESELVKLLLMVVRYIKENKVKDDPNANIILNTVFSASVSDLALLKCLKKVNSEDTLIILNILLRCLNDSLSSNDKGNKPTDVQILNWTCLLIQSHMEALLFSSDKKTVQLLRKLEKLLSDTMEKFDDVQEILAYLTILKKQENILPRVYVVGKYCIETLDS